MQIPTHDYIATAQCGCIVGLIADMPDRKKETAKEVAFFIKSGCTVKHISRSSDEFKQALENFGHQCQPEQLSFLKEQPHA